MESRPGVTARYEGRIFTCRCFEIVYCKALQKPSKNPSTAGNIYDQKVGTIQDLKWLHGVRLLMPRKWRKTGNKENEELSKIPD
jgi:hypothetical protein